MTEVARVTLVVLYWFNGTLHVSETPFTSTAKCYSAGMTLMAEAKKMDKKASIANWSCETRKADRK